MVFNIVGAKRTREIQRIAVEESRLKIPLLIGFDVVHGYRTIFPIPWAESASWDLDLMRRTARALLPMRLRLWEFIGPFRQWWMFAMMPAGGVLWREAVKIPT